MRNSILSRDLLRKQFSHAMSKMYREEVPKYGSLIALVEQVNQQQLEAKPRLKKSLATTNNLERLSEERHGAIRLGKAEELFNMRRLFAQFGMYPVGYYDLSVAGIPVHSTSFRPLKPEALSVNAFRVFTSLLRSDLIADAKLRAQATEVLAGRNIFSPQLLQMIQNAEQQGGIRQQQSQQFLALAVNVFRWHQEALVDAKLYQQLNNDHRLVADVVSFKGPHINHLTPATLDIDAVQGAMPSWNIAPKAVIEGPPKRRCPLLLRQTSFKALKEEVKFLSPEGLSPGAFSSSALSPGESYQAGAHSARFGEIEQRGIALTRKGQALYDELLTKTRQQVSPAADGSNAETYVQVLETTFAAFPDTYAELRAQELAYFHYSVAAEADIEKGRGQSINQLIERGFVRVDPILYEDFLPVSAAGIFQSNLGECNSQQLQSRGNQELFEEQLGEKVADYFELYQRQQQLSIDACLAVFANL